MDTPPGPECAQTLDGSDCSVLARTATDQADEILRLRAERDAAVERNGYALQVLGYFRLHLLRMGISRSHDLPVHSLLENAIWIMGGTTHAQ